MVVQPVPPYLPARPSRVIAEALVERQSPCQILDRATTLGFPEQLTQIMVVVCGATAIDSRRPEPNRLFSSVS